MLAQHAGSDRAHSGFIGFHMPFSVNFIARKVQERKKNTTSKPFCTVVGLVEIPYFTNEAGVMDKNGKTGRRYSTEERAAAVRLVRIQHAELGTDRGNYWVNAGRFSSGRSSTQWFSVSCG